MAKVKKTVKKSVKKTVNKKTPAKKSKSTKSQKAAPKKIAAPNPKKAIAAKKSASPSKSAAPVNISPVRSRVIIRRDEGDEKTAGGLYIPETAKEKPVMGWVVAVGPGGYSKKGFKKAMDVKVGDHVVFSRYTGSPVTVDGQDLLVVEEAEIIGIVQD